MNRTALRNGLLLSLPLWLLIVLAVVFWHYTMMMLVGLICLSVLRRKVFGRRPRSSFANNVKALAMAYAAWNSRWLKPSQFKARTSRAKGAWPDPHAPGGVALSEDFKWPEGY